MSFTISTQNLDTFLNTDKPYSYNEWLQHNSGVVFEESADLYNQYITKWYKNSATTSNQTIDNIKQEYINLLKELTYFFNEEEKNLFLKDINFNNDIEIIYAIPFFVKKLKEIALTISKKRESLKKTKQKYTSIGSTESIENILYEYILNAHTQSSTTTQIAISSLGSTFPELSAVQDNFSIEIEEIYDTGVYADEDPSINIKSINTTPLISNNSLFSVFNTFLENINNEVTPLSAYTEYNVAGNSNIYNQIKLNEKYLGSTIYGLTAVPYTDSPDEIINMQFYAGNNWFYWPSGETFTDLESVQNNYKDILLQNSVFTISGTAGSSYTNSDLMFVESRGSIEGAWLRGTISKEVTGQMVMTSQPNEIRSFIYPYPGYGLTTTYKWAGRALDDEGLTLFNLLDPSIKTEILQKYFTAGLETSTISSKYINQTSLANSKAHAGSTSLHGDNITIRPGGLYNDVTQLTSTGVYNDSDLTQSAYLFKLTSTEIPIDADNTNILWPITTYTTKEPRDERIVVRSDTCRDVYVGNIDISKHMIGAVAGMSPDTSDVMYKLSKKGGAPVEAAWLQAGSIKTLATYNAYSIPVYNTPAVNCISVVDGPIQPNLSFICEADKKVSFIWCDVDTPADKVFNYRPHALDCPYLKLTPSYQNSSNTDWDKCTCKALNYSPIGHIGDKIVDYYGAADYLFADPQNMNESFSLTKWRDTRNFNFQNSPQFSYYKKTNKSAEDAIGWGPGKWQTGDGSPMILRTGRQYTYFRSGMRNLNTDTAVPGMVAHYPYKLIISSVQTTITTDTILVIDASGSQYYSIDKIKQLAEAIVNYIDTTKNTQIGVVVFTGAAATASYLSISKESVIAAIRSIVTPDTTANSNIADGLSIAYKMMTNVFTGGGKSLSGLCNNLQLSVSTPYDLAYTSNIPNDKNIKNIILFSDGAEIPNTGRAAIVAEEIKSKNIKIISVDIGPNSTSNNLMERIATSTQDYFNYEKSLIQNDSAETINNIANGIIYNVYGSVSVRPVWRKAIVTGTTVTPSYDISDMMLRPGDYIQYSHTSQVSYDSFFTLSVPFVINMPLYGWNYDTQSYDGKSLGAKPYWGKVYNYPNIDANFTKYAREFGGSVRYFNGYIPISQPEVSDIQLNINDYVEYRNKGCSTFQWKEKIDFLTQKTDRQWLRLKSCIQSANLKDLFNSLSLDKIFEETEEASNIVLKTYNDYTPAYYCYFALNSLYITQPLYISTRDIQTYSNLVTGIVIAPTSEYMNLTNTHYASIANAPLSANFVTKKDVGGYLLPHTLGVPYYLGYGHINEINIKKLNTSSNFIFADPNKYTSNRGLTKKDQMSPYETTHVDNTWIKESFNAGKKAGNIINAVDYQKFVPYQSNYESTKYNIYGLSRQNDIFEFWTGAQNNVWNDEVIYPSNYKKEPYRVQERTKNLLVTDKELTTWQTDIYGNNYGILKSARSTKSETITSAGELWVRDVNDSISDGPTALKLIYDQYTDKIDYYNDITTNSIIDIQIFLNVLYIKTNSGISFNKINYSADTSRFTIGGGVPGVILSTNKLISDTWYDEATKRVYLSAVTRINSTTLKYYLYEYNVDKGLFNLTLEDTINMPTSIVSIKPYISFAYNADTITFSTTFIFNTSKICIIEAKNFTTTPYIVSVTVGV